MRILKKGATLYYYSIGESMLGYHSAAVKKHKPCCAVMDNLLSSGRFSMQKNPFGLSVQFDSYQDMFALKYCPNCGGCLEYILDRELVSVDVMIPRHSYEYRDRKTGEVVDL